MPFEYEEKIKLTNPVKATHIRHIARDRGTDAGAGH